MPIKHGVFVEERNTALTSAVTAQNSVQCVIGVAPVWMLDNPEAVTNVPVVCDSASEAMEKLGYLEDFEKYSLCQSMYVTSEVFPVSPVVYINVLDVTKAAHKNTEEEVTITQPVALRNVIDKAAVIKKTVSIVQGATTLVKDTDYTLEYDSAGKLVVNFIPGGNFSDSTNAVVTLTTAKPSGVTASDIIGSYNASTGAATGAEAIQYVYPKLGLVPTIILAPGWSQNSLVGLALAAKAANVNGVFKGIAVVDIDTTQATAYSGVGAQKTAAGYTSPHCYPIWLCVKIGSLIVAGSAVAAACMAFTDAGNGGIPSRTPSNKLMSDVISGTCLASGVEVLLTQDQASAVNGVGVATFVNLGGWRVWGSYTGAYPTVTEIKDMWLPVRRMFDWQANSFIQTYLERVDDPLNYVLIESIVDSENIRCGAYAPDQWAGAEIQFVEADNSEEDLLAGRIVFRQKIAPYTPAQEITNILSYDTSLLTASLEGLTTT